MTAKHMVAILVVALVISIAPASSVPAATPAASNASSPWAETEHGGVRLIAAVTGVGEDATLPLGLEFRMAPGWHIYWRSPGDAGYPPRAEWAGSRNLQSAELHWPAPHRFAVLDLQTIGYSDTVILPVEARLQTAGEAVALRATVDYLTCADICVPYVAELALDLPAGPAAASAYAHDIARANAQVPGEGLAHRLTIERAAVEPGPGGPVLAVSVRAEEPLAAPDVFIEAPPPLVFGAPRIRFAADRLSAVLRVDVGNIDGLGAPLVGMPATVTVVDEARATEQTVVLAPAGAAAEDTHSSIVILALALLGGLVLNLMPCVLPVLSMKLLAVVSHGGGDRRHVRIGFIAAALGIFFSFMLLAGALIALKATGAAVGWGLQFQQPWFLVAMILVVTLFAANLWGLFEVPLPRLFGLASERTSRMRGLVGHFLTGALATLLATPCSAPFLGTAIGFALARGPAEITLVFAAIAFGLALPYLSVAAFPGLATALPKPGRWMVWLRRVLSLTLIATAIWLAWVLAGSVGWSSAVTVTALVSAIVLVLVFRRRMPPPLRRAGVAAMMALAVTAFLVPPDRTAGARLPSRGSEDAANWQPFDPARIAEVVAGGGTVWVNVTADWCLTCKVNERFVLDREPVAGRLAGDGVVAMRGDWTQPDAAIAHYLAGFGRYGIPFDAVYGPAIPTGEALPELLTESAVLSALDRATTR